MRFKLSFFSTVRRRLKLQILWVVFLLLIHTGSIVSGASVTLYDVEKSYIQKALSNNRELQSFAEKIKALKERIPLAGALENPRLGFGLANLPVDTFDLDQEPMTQKQIFLSQKVPWFGKRDLARRVADLTAMQQEYLFKAKQLQITRLVSQHIYDMQRVVYSLEITEGLEQLISQILRVAETRYATGKGLQQNILEAQVQLSSLLDNRIQLQGEKRKLESSLGELVNSEETEKLSLPAPPTEELIDLPDSEVLKRLAQQRNPQITAARVGVEKARHQMFLAEKEYKPDMDFRLAYGQREDDPTSGDSRADFLSATITFSLPVHHSTRQGPKLSSSKRSLMASEKNLAALENSLSHRIDGLVSEIETYQQSQQLMEKGLVLQSQQLAEASLSAYSVGKVEFGTMLDAQIKTLRYQKLAYTYRTMVLKKRAELYEVTAQMQDVVEGILKSSDEKPADEEIKG